METESMNSHDIGQLLGALAIFVFLLLSAKGNTSFKRNANRPKREEWRRWVTGIALLQACMFVAVALACEAAGTHWIVGVFCVLGSFSCTGIAYFLNSPVLENPHTYEGQTKSVS
jgi:amino acid transporter